MKKIFIGLLISFLISACGKKGEQKSETGTDKKKFDSASCKYAVDAKKSKVKWTSFKLTERIGVGGTFDSVTISHIKNEKDALDAIRGLSFSVATGSVNSNLPDRDNKLVNKFFGVMKNGFEIKGIVKSIDDTSAVISIFMNGFENDLSLVSSKIDETHLTLKGSMNTEDWEAQSSLQSLNKVCELLHTGSDGLSKLWPDVDIELSVVLAKNCE